jgi:hypothetical protein
MQSSICQSRVSRVTVHGRGALVTRRVDVPADLPDDDEIELIVPQVTVLADGGSVRAALDGGARTVVSVQTSLYIPEETLVPGASVEKIRSLEAKIARLTDERNRVEARRRELAGLGLDPRLAWTAIVGGVDARVGDALATAGMLTELVGKQEARLVELDTQLEALGHEINAARLADQQAASAARVGQGHPTRRINVKLAGKGAVPGLTLTYTVPAARWWPTYTLRISDGGKKASWWLEALVAQLTGEDWSSASLSLSTADLIFDARLPELPSLRLGRAQPPAKKGYRPPPEGLDRMFAAYARAFPGRPPETESNELAAAIDRLVAAPATTPVTTTVLAPPMGQGMPAAKTMALSMSESAPPTRPKGGAKKSVAYDAMPAPAAAPAPMRNEMARQAKPMMRDEGAAGGDASDDLAMDTDEEAVADGSVLGGLADARGGIEPSDTWLDFDALKMTGPDSPGRGRLKHGGDPAYQARANARGRIEQVAPGPALKDPVATRGRFDHRYDASGAVEIPSDGLPHRIALAVGEAPSTVKYRTVPRESQDVFREVELKNPFAAPLLAGPVDVYVEGSLLLTTEIERIDRGGTMTVGMGVEDRIRVARNARVDEESAGLLRGNTVVDATVTIDLTSALGREVKVLVVDRIPTSSQDPKNIEVELVSAQPSSQPYKQEERGRPIEKGLLWALDVPASGKARVTFRYKISFSSKSELVGGNRRE